MDILSGGFRTATGLVPLALLAGGAGYLYNKYKKSKLVKDFK